VPSLRLSFRLSCLAYLGVSLPGSTLGLLWPSMHLSFHVPIGALGILLIFGVAASAVASAATGRVLSLVGAGPLMVLATAALALALAGEAIAPSVWVFGCGMVLFGLGIGATDSTVNAHAAESFSARQINWMHASYGLGATAGPLLVTALLSSGLSWRWSYGIMAAVEAAVALVFMATLRAWPEVARKHPVPPPGARRERPPLPVVLGALTFTAVETGIESAAGIWGYVFLTAGRGLSPQVAGVSVAAYWATMFAGRMVLGPVAGRVGAQRVLVGAIAGVAAGAAVMAVPGPGWLSVAGLMVLGLAAAPIFPLLMLTTSQRMGTQGEQTTRTVGLQVAASAVGSAALPGGVGVAVGALGAGILGPLLLVLGLAMCATYRLISSPGYRAAKASASTPSPSSSSD
jgi:fucose permease